jgi:DNA transposition AAA+ family ATPase
MRDKFVEVRNVRKFRAIMDRMHRHLKGQGRLALIFGDPGLGKTETALNYAANNGAIYIRMKKLMKGRWLLRDLVNALGSEPRWTAEDLFNQVTDILKQRKRTLILDEIDYFSQDSRVTETVRDISDATGVEILFLGMGQADKRLMRYPHLYDRFFEILKFQPLDKEDVELMAKDLSEVTFEADAIDKIVDESGGGIRRILALLHRGEYVAHKNRLKFVSVRDLK